jgi:kexin
VAVIDDGRLKVLFNVINSLSLGIAIDHDDIKPNFFEPGSYDFNEKTKLPLARNAEDYHGTRCAGEIAAAVNSACGVGVAYNAKVSGK